MTVFQCGIATLPFLVFYGFSLVKSLHMFQLNSYKPATHYRWLRKNAGCFLPGVVGAVLCDLAMIRWGWLFCLLLTAGFAVLAALARPKKAKKPLVYTKRAIRMLVTAGFLTLLVFIPWAVIRDTRIYLATVALLSLCCPVVILVANWVNQPIELSIKRYCIRDAKKRLKSNPELITIGVTGSYGKTSVKYILSTLLQAEYNVLMTPESYNTPMGVVITVRNHLRPTHEIFVCEMGARHVGDIKELCDIVHPDHGIITSVGPQHLETFHTLDNIKKTKFELADALPDSGTVFLNGEDANIRACTPRPGQKAVSYGLTSACTYYADNISCSSRGTSFTAHTPDGRSAVITARLIGAHNVINIIGAIAICCELGIPLEKLKIQAKKLESVPHRLQLIRQGNGLIIDDAYNSNPSGAKAAIDALALFDGFKILVTPGMVELGEKQAELNRYFGAYAAGVCDYVILVGQRPDILEGLLSQGYPSEKIYTAKDIHDALASAWQQDPGGREKIILLENDLPDNY